MPFDKLVANNAYHNAEDQNLISSLHEHRICQNCEDCSLNYTATTYRENLRLNEQEITSNNPREDHCSLLFTAGIID